MPMSFEFIPPKVNTAAALRVAAEMAVEIGGKLLLDASQELVPVGPSSKNHKGGTLKSSGKVEPDGPLTVAVSYEAYSPEGYNYGVRQHEDMTLHHEDGKSAKFLEKPMHSEGHAILEAMAETIRAGL